MIEKLSLILYLLYKYVILFSFGTITGWLIEVIWRRFYSQKRWFNPGFLHGPWLPLYGFGAILLYSLSSINIPIYVRGLLFFIVLTILEYIAGIVFLKFFKMRLWDYSNRRINIQGVICPLYSFLWTILGFIFYYFVFPFLNGMVSTLYSYPFFSFFLGIYAGLFGLDLWKSFDIAGRIRHYFIDIEEKGHIDFELLKLELSKRVKLGFRNKTYFFLPFSGELGEGFKDRLAKHRLNLSKKNKNR